MSIHLMVEILDNPPAGLTHQDIRLLLAVAEKADDTTRECWPGWKLLAHRMGWSGHKDSGQSALRHALRDMAARGVDIRVPLGYNPDGTPYYAVNGHRTRYRLPVFAAPQDATERGADSDPLPARGAGSDPLPPERGADSNPLPARGSDSDRLKGVAEHPPAPEERGSLLTSKGVTPRLGRGSASAPRIPQEPSMNPHPPTRAQERAEGALPGAEEEDDKRINRYLPARLGGRLGAGAGVDALVAELAKGKVA